MGRARGWRRASRPSPKPKGPPGRPPQLVAIDAWRARKRVELGAPGRGGVPGPRRRYERDATCDRCGRTYQALKTAVYGRNFCGPICRHAAYRRRKRARAGQSAVAAVATRQCAWCGSDIDRRPRAKYCPGDACRQAAYRSRKATSPPPAPTPSPAPAADLERALEDPEYRDWLRGQGLF